EGERHHRRAECLGLLDGAFDQRLMATMHAVEIAERDGGALPRRRYRLPIVEAGNHANPQAWSRRGTRTMASPSITTLSPLKHWVLSVTRRRLSSMAVMVATAV